MIGRRVLASKPPPSQASPPCSDAVWCRTGPRGSSLQMAAQNGHAEVVVVLLDRGPDPSRADDVPYEGGREEDRQRDKRQRQR
jgi:hypothetical protein